MASDANTTRSLFLSTSAPRAHVHTLRGSSDAASIKLRAETSKIVGCVAKYCEEVPDPPRRDKRVRHVPDVVPVEVYANVEEATADRNMASALAEDPTCQSQARTKTTRPDISAQSRTRSQEDQDNTCKSCIASAEVKPSSNGNAGRGEPCCRLETLKVPATLTSSEWVYSALKQSGDEWLCRAVAILDAKKEEKVPDVQELWNYKRESPVEKSFCDKRQTVEPQQVPLPSFELRRMQCDWCEVVETGERFVYDESCKVLQKVIRANSQATLFVKDVAVPSVLDREWAQSLYKICPTKDEGELQQLLLPFCLVRDDEAKVTSAPSKIISIADRCLRSLQCTDVSLTIASMNVPSIWNHKAALNGLANLVTEQLKVAVMQPSSTCLSVPDSSQASGIVSTTSSQVPSSANKGCERHDLLPESGLLPSAPAKVEAAADLSTDYFLSDKFLSCNWSEVPDETSPYDATLKTDASSNPLEKPSKYSQLLQRIARPALWDLMRKKLLQVDMASFQQALDRVSLEALEAIIYKQYQDVRKMSMNPSAFSSVEIVEACTSLRQAVWLHTLRIVSIGQMAAAHDGKMMTAVLTKILPSAKYKLALGSSNWKEFYTLSEAIGGHGVPSDTLGESATQEASSSATEDDAAIQPPHKKPRILMESKNTPVRVLCSVQFLQQDELLDELCTEHQIFFIERDLPPPIDMVVDERNCICVVTDSVFQAEASMRDFIFSLARAQLQFQKCWLVIVLDDHLATGMEDAMNTFFSALVQFHVEIQVLTSFSCEEAGRFVRAIVDQCAEIALNDYHILPRMWFERPFLLEDESQFERFLVSTRIVNNYAAQSLLHKICMDDLFSKGIDELKLLIQNALTERQLELLWRFVQQGHGLNGALQ